MTRFDKANILELKNYFWHSEYNMNFILTTVVNKNIDLWGNKKRIMVKYVLAAWDHS